MKPPRQLTDEKLIEHANLVLEELAFRDLLDDELPKIPDGMIDFEAAERKMLLEEVPKLQWPRKLSKQFVYDGSGYIQQVGPTGKQIEEIKKQMDDLDKPPTLEERAFREEVLKTEAEVMRDLEDERFEKFLDRLFWFLVLLIPSSAGVFIYYLLKVCDGK